MKCHFLKASIGVKIKANLAKVWTFSKINMASKQKLFPNQTGQLSLNLGTHREVLILNDPKFHHNIMAREGLTKCYLLTNQTSLNWCEITWLRILRLDQSWNSTESPLIRDFKILNPQVVEMMIRERTILLRKLGIPNLKKLGLQFRTQMKRRGRILNLKLILTKLTL